MQEGLGVFVEAEKGYLKVRGRLEQLPPTALRMLEYLVANSQKHRTKMDIAFAIWGEDTPKRRRQIETVVRQIRAAIEKKPLQPELLLTKDRFGYIFDPSCPEMPEGLYGAISRKGIVLWPEGKRVFIRGAEVNIGWQPFLILHRLMENAGGTCTVQSLLRAGWPDREPGLGDINEAILNLRILLGAPETIICIGKRGCLGCKGYMFVG